MLLQIIVCLIATVAAYVFWSRRQTFKMRSDMGLSGPPVNFLLGNTMQIQKIVEEKSYFFKAFTEWKRAYGKIYGCYLGPKLFVMVEDTNMIKEIFIKQFTSFTDRQDMFMLRKSLVESLINLRGSQWKQVRNIITPTFSTMKMKQMSSIIVEKADVLCSNIVARTDNDTSFDLYTDFKCLTIDVIAKCAFAMHSDSLNDVNDKFFGHVRTYFAEIPMPETSKLMQLGVIFPELGPMMRNIISLTSSQAVSEDWLFDNLMAIMEERKKNFKTFESVDILQAMVEQSSTVEDRKKNTTLTDLQIADNCFVFLLAGYETTSTALGFTAWLLATHPVVQTHLQQELDANVGSKDEINYDIAMKLPYLDAVFHEALRLFPPVVFFTNRTCVEDCVVNGVTFKKGVQVGIPVWEVHHDPDNWPQPNSFKPERFYQNKDWDQLTWLPFGVGPRNCVGLRFAEMEYKITLARLLYQVTILRAPDTETEPLPLNNPGALINPKHVTVRVTKRKKPISETAL